MPKSSTAKAWPAHVCTRIAEMQAAVDANRERITKLEEETSTLRADMDGYQTSESPEFQKAAIAHGAADKELRFRRKHRKALARRLSQMVMDATRGQEELFNEPEPLLSKDEKVVRATLFPAQTKAQANKESADNSDDPANAWRDERFAAVEVRTLDAPDRAIAALVTAGLDTVGRIAKYTSDGSLLSNIKGIGKSAEREIETALQKLAAGG